MYYKIICVGIYTCTCIIIRMYMYIHIIIIVYICVFIIMWKGKYRCIQCTWSYMYIRSMYIVLFVGIYCISSRFLLGRENLCKDNWYSLKRLQLYTYHIMYSTLCIYHCTLQPHIHVFTCTYVYIILCTLYIYVLFVHINMYICKILYRYT